jgi:hypothetical protein
LNALFILASTSFVDNQSFKRLSFSFLKLFSTASFAVINLASNQNSSSFLFIIGSTASCQSDRTLKLLYDKGHLKSSNIAAFSVLSSFTFVFI